MMPLPPFFGFPRQNPNTYHTYYSKNNNMKNEKKPYFPNVSQNNFRENFSVSNKNIENQKKSNETNNFDTNNYSSCEHEEMFNICGIKLSFDDLLIICLLLFLYSENVKDNFLYLALLSLLFVEQ